MWFFALLPALASDHFDGPAASRDPARDLTDLYAWVEEKQGRSSLALILDLHPYATHRSRFSPDYTYRISLRRASIDGTGADTHISTGEAFTIDCHLVDTLDAMRCRIEPVGVHCPGCTRVITAPLDDPNGASVPGVRLFAGLRRDPFFINTLVVSDPPPRAGERSEGRSIDVTDNILVRASVLSLVFEIDPQEILGGDGLFAASGRVIWKARLTHTPRLGRLK